MKKDIKKMKTGVIGVGSMGKNHVRVYKEISDLVGVSDLNEELGLDMAGKYGIKFFGNYEEMLDKVDAVSIAVPTKYHLEVATNVIKAGVNLIIEKPLSDNVSDALKIVELSEKHNVCLSVGHIERHNPVISNIKENLSKNIWGQPISFSTRRFSSFPGRIIDVGVVFDLAIHDIDILNYLSSSTIKSVYALGGRKKHKNCEDYVIILLDFHNGIKGLCEANWLTPTKVRDLSLTTDNSHILANYMDQSLEITSAKNNFLSSSNSFSMGLKFDKEIIHVERHEPLKLELVDFLSSILEKGDPLVTGMDGVNAVKVAEAVILSLEKGSKIEIN